ncbi:MAG: flagellar biosynthesis protein FlgN [Treponema sp. GWB1_62_6]|nr:MAG: flagellar biosynthesis protein FlgN [Treponema sp. GWB1_62_6]OHE75693.1 MAG: flagellar biosynthesis protein FlgN [Treponema sp. RIFOXYC1_FULL_61_9]HCM26181.1 flagellar biosynthesis protein FlgN [Treponema sp.]
MDMTSDELDRRVAVLKRFRELLVGQRDRFREYLTVLDKQNEMIRSGDAEALVSHVELEEKIVAEIFAIQKVVDPMEGLYRAAFPDKESEVPRLKEALAELKAEAVSRSERNRSLLAEKMEGIRTEVRGLRNNPFAKRRSVYADEGAATLVDVKG